MKSHTFSVTYSFTFQHSFVESEVEQDPDGSDVDLIPTEAALSALQSELEAKLGDEYSLSSLSLDADSDKFLGTAEDESSTN
jgi:hypothetical protein